MVVGCFHIKLKCVTIPQLFGNMLFLVYREMQGGLYTFNVLVLIYNPNVRIKERVALYMLLNKSVFICAV